jgi:thymidine kinase
VTDDALTPAGEGEDRLPGRATLKFFYGPMDCGKSTLALQIDHNHTRKGRHGLVFTRDDRAGQSKITTRIGLARAAVECLDTTDLRQVVREQWATGARVDYLICDEAQFYSTAQVEQMADLVDRAGVDVYAFGLATDFRTELFPASRRLFELADEVVRLQVEVLCWCGRPGQLNARVVDGAVAREGEQVLIGDTCGLTTAEAPAPAPLTDQDVRYQVLCRRHHRAGDLGPAATAAGQLRLV